MFVAVASLAQATVLTGELVISGAADLFSRGFGRSIGFNLSANDGSFQVSGGCSDTLREDPGGNTASLIRSSECGPLTVNGAEFTGRSGSVFTFETALPVSLPALIPGPNIGDFIDVTLPPVPFTLSSRLTVADFFQPDVILIDTDVTGSGLVLREGRIVRDFDRVYGFIYESRFEFTNVPEPASLWLIVTGGIVLAVRWRGSAALPARNPALLPTTYQLLPADSTNRVHQKGRKVDSRLWN